MGVWFRQLVAIAAAVACLAPGFAAADPPASPPLPTANTIRPDPAIRTGVLANGLRYAVMQNATPKGGVSIRFGVAVGSNDEAAGQHGAAHFLEHMAFGGSEAQLEASVERAFADAGVAFGRDRNARTTTHDTVFQIDLPHADDADLDLAFRWMRQVADGAQLTPDTVNRERGVILAERETRLSDQSQADDAARAFQAPGTRLAASGVIGDAATISQLSAAQLQAFYDGWYRPENAVVVVVGDQPAEQLEARLRQSFDSWHGRGAPAAQPAQGRVDLARGVDAQVLTEPNLAARVRVCRAQDDDAGALTDVASERRAYLARLWERILGARLLAAAQAPGAPLLSGTATLERERGLVQLACVTGASTDDGWPQALGALRRETDRLLAGPPSEDELELAIRYLRGAIRADEFGRDTRQSPALAQNTAVDLLRGDATPDPFEQMRVFDAAIEDVAPADVQAAFARDWAGAGPLITVVAPKPLTTEAARLAWAAAPTPDAAQAGAAAPTWRYAAFGAPGRVVKREVIADGDFTRLTFANGLVVNLKQTAFAADEVDIRIRFGAGRRDIARGDTAAETVAASLFGRGGLGRNRYGDLAQLFPEASPTVTLATTDEAFVLSARSSPSSLAHAMQILAAYMSDPGFRDLDQLAPAVWESAVRTLRSRPLSVAGEALLDGVDPANPRTSRSAPTPAALTSAALGAILRPAVTTAPIELTLVGALDLDETAEIVADTFGALPRRAPAAPSRGDTWFLRFPVDPPAELHGYHDGPPEKAAVAMVWPLYVAGPARRPEEHALRLVALVYQEALLRRIRGELGRVYSPAATTLMPDDADQGYLVAQMEVSGADVATVRTEMAAVAAKVAAGDFTDDDLETVRRPYIARLQAGLRTNTAWAAALSASVAMPGELDELQGLPAAFAAITAADVRKAAAEWLSKRPITVVVTAQPAAAAGVSP